MSDKYLTQVEMQEIINACNILDTVFAMESEIIEVSVGITSTDEGDGRLFAVYDTNGEKLGDIGLTDGGTFGLYLTATDDDR